MAQKAKDQHQPRLRTAVFRFYAELNDYLPAHRRKTEWAHTFRGTPSIGDTIQAIGVPHTEVDLILVDGQPVDFLHRMTGGERIAVYPVFERLDISPVVRLRPAPLRQIRFVLDAHLGRLARYLRMLGFDARWQREIDDPAMIDIALAERRIILTRDVGLLKNRRVTHGYWLRHQQPEDQLEEVLLAFHLLGQLEPLRRCLDCNGEIRPLAYAEAEGLVDPDIHHRFDSFRQCGQCGKVYWQGSHYRKMLDFIESIRSRAVVDQMSEPAAYPHETEPVIRRVETHISWVLLTGEFAYKVKKPVMLGFLDFSTLERRRHYCEEEVRVNRRTAPDLYLDAVPVGQVEDGIRVGLEPAIEYAVRMRQFPHAARLDRCLKAGNFGAPQARELGHTIAAFHAALTPRRDCNADVEPERSCKPARNNFRHLDSSLLNNRSRQQAADIETWTLQQSSLLRPVFRNRALGGAIRECHGDLHLENLLYSDGRFTLFDAIEFDPELRWIDIANDLAFLVMDLMARGFEDLGFVVLNSWLEDLGDYGSLAVMRFYLVYRGMVRAVVNALRPSRPAIDAEGSFRLDANRYIRLAAALANPRPPRLLLMHGFSGAGKTWLSERLIGALPALRVRSDLERKRLAAADPTEHFRDGIGKGMYESEVTDQTYELLAGHCETGLRAGFTMIADATFLRRRHRRQFIEMAGRVAVPVSIVDCRAEVETLRRNILHRSEAGTDASDADLAVLEHQLQHHDPLDESEQQLIITEDLEFERMMADRGDR